MSELPSSPWHTLYVDQCGPSPTDDFIIVVTDEYNRCPEITIVKSTSASTTINPLRCIFATHGLQSRTKTDNGSPFNSKQLKDYLKEN